MSYPSPPLGSIPYMGAGELTIVHASRQKSVCPLRWKDTIFLAASFTYLSISSRPAVFCGTGLRFLTEKPILPVSLEGARVAVPHAEDLPYAACDHAGDPHVGVEA